MEQRLKGKGDAASGDGPLWRSGRGAATRVSADGPDHVAVDPRCSSRKSVQKGAESSSTRRVVPVEGKRGRPESALARHAAAVEAKQRRRRATH